MRGFNFGAGPAMLPTTILEEARNELLDWQQTGMSILEIGHRTEHFRALLDETENNFRKILNIPSHYAVLFLTAPARSQFAMVPLNLLGNKTEADYFDTGIWSALAIKEAARYAHVNCVASSKDDNYHSIPERATWKLNPEAAYVHYTPNETINGVEFPFIPNVGSVPLVADMTSTIFSQPIDVSRFGIIYAGAQKNIAPAGLTLVIIRHDLLDRVSPATPSLMQYILHHQERSLLHTPNTFSCYIACLMSRWIENRGGLKALEKLVIRKAQLLYDCIDHSGGFYRNLVYKTYRSRTNIPFEIYDKTLEVEFLRKAERAHLLQLRGHKLVGGLRASLYNAMPEEGVKTLVAFMQDFMQKHG